MHSSKNNPGGSHDVEHAKLYLVKWAQNNAILW